MTDARLVRGDVLRFVAHYKGPKFHALLCDPPYHLTSITKRFGKNGSKPAEYGTDGAFQRASKGFMNQVWDGGNTTFDPETWAALGELLYPGAFGMAFASSRGWHRLAVAIEDGGMIIHPTIFGWLQGQGFPKATRISDKRFEGHRYGLQAMKPSLEPIIVFQKLYQGRPVDSIVETGAGALNIDGSRIPTDASKDDPRLGGKGTWKTDKAAKNVYEGGYAGQDIGSSPMGRWPSNFALVCSPDCEGDNHVPDCPVARLDEQAGICKPATSRSGAGWRTQYIGGEKRKDVETVVYQDKDNASRFFFRASWELEHTDPILYCPKVSRNERDAGLDKLLTHKAVGSDFNGGNLNDLRMSHPQNRQDTHNSHPTLKPISLCKWLATLLLPPPEYAPRRLLVPFAGTGSEMIGAAQAGWDEIIGIEKEKEYVELGKARLAHWLKKELQPSLL